MDINTLDDLLKYMADYTEIRLYENTKELERSIVLDAVEKGLLYNANSNVYKLDGLGNEVVMSRLSWNDFLIKKKKEENALVQKAVDYMTAKKKNPDAIGYTSEPLPFGGIYPDSKPTDGVFAQISKAGMGNSLPVSMKRAAEVKARDGYIEALANAIPTSEQEKQSKVKVVRKSVSKFLQHWFVEKYIKVLLFLLLGIVATYFYKEYKDGQKKINEPNKILKSKNKI